ncbi:hypothetical protein SAMN02787142_1378 [Burkholderia sp. WP9]|nr:hypothetical protein SAMN02787142_1378 [Burkholderia sp. WP9]
MCLRSVGSLEREPKVYALWRANWSASRRSTRSVGGPERESKVHALCLPPEAPIEGPPALTAI